MNDETLEQRVVEVGRRLLTAADAQAETGGGDRWLDRFLDRIMDDPAFRVQALRFVDVLPALTDDRDLVRHLHEYFGADDLHLTGLIRFGVRLARTGLANPLIAAALRKSIAHLARRFVGGADAAEALGTARALWDRGIRCSLDLLGEATVSEAEAETYQHSYLKLLTELSAGGRDWPASATLDQHNGRPAPRVNLSLKVSSLYSQINPADPHGSIDGITRRLRPILRAARDAGAFVMLDMEQYDTKDIILACFRTLLTEPELRDWPDCGIALQAYLTDSERNLAELVDWTAARGTPVTVRLVRGAYWDYETVVAQANGWPLPVWGEKRMTDACYERCLRRLLAHHPQVEAAVATHNVRSMAFAIAAAEAGGLSPDQYEMQMLHGMAPAFEDALPRLGHRLRVYVPFGDLLPGMAYLVRRLLENSSSQSFQRMRSRERATPEALLASPHPAPIVRPRRRRAAPSAALAEFRNEPPHRFTDAAERQGFASALAEARSDLDRTYPLRIDGERVSTRDRIASLNPARPREVIGRVACADLLLADRAIAGAQRALPAWAGQPADARAGVLLRAAAELRRRRDEFAAFEILEAGKNWQEADADVTEAIDYLEYHAREALRLDQSRGRNVAGETNVLRYRPRGVGLIAPPWNFPLAILTGMLSAAIAAGNTALLKPSSQTPVIAARFVDLLHDAGLPPGVVQFLPGPGRSVGDYLVRHPHVHFIAFTGSAAVGTGIVKLAADLAPGQRHVKHVIAEMGGKNAIIVDSDADLDDAVRGVVQSAFGYQGQKCSACSRVIVVGDHHDRFLRRLIEATASLPMGMPEDAGVFLGPVIEEAARDRINAMIEAAAHYARPAFRMDCSRLTDGWFVGPAIFSEVPAASPLAQEEIFGPVLAVMRAADLGEALALANGTPCALTGGLYSRSPANIERVKGEFDAGNLYINRKITGALVERQPFGGYRLSGLGTKAGGPDYLLQFVLPQTVTENTLRRGFAPAADA